MARSDRLSDDLLALEEVAFDRCWATFQSAAKSALARYESAWRNGKDAKKVVANASLLNDLTRMHTAAVEACRPIAREMAEEALRLIMESIDDELLVCEATLAKRYEGTTKAAMLLAGPEFVGLVQARMEAFDQSVLGAKASWTTQAKRQMLLSSMREEDRDHAERRLFQAEARPMPGMAGRGVWWRAVPILNGSTRDVSIRLAGQVRIAAMKTFNEVGAALA